MFYVAEALLDREGLAFSSHAAVTSAFGQHLDRQGKVPLEFHRQLIDAQTLRTRADHDATSKLSRQDAETLISQAQVFIATAWQNLN